MSTPTEVYLPLHLPYPIKILSLSAKLSDTLERGTRLLEYSFLYPGSSTEPHKETRFGTWDSLIDGEVVAWKLKKGEKVSARRAQESPALLVNEPCKHGVQIGGLCAMCGKDMTAQDYLGASDMARASIPMTHSAAGPTVSIEEAERIERQTAEHLLRSRRLSLIVDLDQTIVHATVDPTVGDWIAEGESWEVRHRDIEPRDGRKDDTNDSQGTSSDEDAVNPNWDALKDVRQFRLGPEHLGKPRSSNVKGKQKTVDNDGCLYYIKPRPGWRSFLQHVAAKYEMHVYTMGTRAYAEQVCAILDEDGQIFGGRLLSRDESGSLTQKSLQRLFPVDTSMVVIIDDRADVWEWSPNLVKVIPYDFFVGIGDINSTYLPKVVPLMPPGDPPTASPSSQKNYSPEGNAPLTPSEELGSTNPGLDTDKTDESEVLQATALLTQNTLELEAQMEERPLAKKQDELAVNDDAGSTDGKSQTFPAATSGGKSDDESSGSPVKTKATRTPLLKNDDTELERVKKLLDDIHKEFYDNYAACHTAPATTNEVAKQSSQHKGPNAHDVRTIIPRLRMAILEGVHIVFSSVIPLDVPQESTEIWRIAHAFGARCHTELSRQITHVVAAKAGTVKVEAARKLGGIKIVSFQWFTDSIALWQRQDEANYIIAEECVASSDAENASFCPLSDSIQESSDIENDVAEGSSKEGARNDGIDEGYGELALEEVNWDDINDEVEAALNESDSEDKSAHGSEASWNDDAESAISAASDLPQKRKRLRSSTPSELGQVVDVSPEKNDLRSPLSKRRKLSADRGAASMLKVEAIFEEVMEDTSKAVSQSSGLISQAAIPAESDLLERDDDRDTDEADDDDEGDLDDFLAREMEEDLG